MPTIIGLFFFLFLPFLSADAHNDDDANSEWYHTLLLPNGPMKGAICCSKNDCKPVLSRIRHDRWEVWIDSKGFPDVPGVPLEGHAPNDWVVVPVDAEIHGKINPEGSEAVACWYNGVVRCFVPGTMT